MATIQEELDVICKANGGLLRPVDVVEFARDTDTELHSRFTWDDTAAAQSYRLWQAREVIRVGVVTVKADIPETRAYVSLHDDGYRTIKSVLRNKERRAAMLEEAFAEFERFEARYRHLEELAKVFDAAKVAKAKSKRKALPKGKSSVYVGA